ncbi:diguanylate cyclase domain-containing protein [Desulfolithobacter sp.]
MDLFYHLPSAGFLLETDSSILKANKQAQTLLGRQESELHGCRLQDYFQAEDKNDFLEFLETVREETQASWQGHIDTGRTITLYNIKASRMADNRLLTLFDPVPLHRQNHTTPSRKHRILEAQYENNPAGILLVNEHMDMISFNRAFLSMWNVPEQIQHSRNGKACLKHVLKQLKEPARFLETVKHLSRQWEEESAEELELRSSRIYYCLTFPVSSSGKNLGRVWYFHDTTALKQAERKIMHQQKFLETVLEHIHDGVIACDAKGRLSLFNKASGRLLKLEDNYMLHPSEWTRHYRLFEADGSTPIPMDKTPLLRTMQGEILHNKEVVIVAGNGQRRDVRISGQAMHDDKGSLLGSVISLHDITDINRIQEQLRHMAYHDPLTGLPNRHLFQDLLEQCLRREQRNKTRMGILFLDLDNFKLINDRLGHKAGDNLLVELAKILRGCLRDSDMICRWGGDEFIIALPELESMDDARLVADKICRTTCYHLNKLYDDTNISASIGISLYPDHGTIPDRLIRLADQAMYTAKKKGKNKYCVITPGELITQPDLPFTSTTN